MKNIISMLSLDRIRYLFLITQAILFLSCGLTFAENAMPLNDDPHKVNGVVKAANRAVLSLSQPGVLIKIPEEGQIVKKGDVLAELDDGKMQIVMAEAKATLETSQLSVEIARHNFAKTKRLLDEKILAPIALVEDEFSLKKAELALKAANSKMDAIRLTSEELKLLAPFDGVITKVIASIGERVGAGKQIIEIVDFNSLEVSLDVPTHKASALEKGFETVVFIEDRPVGMARVKTVLPIIDPASGLQRVICTIIPKDEILIGGYVSLSLAEIAK